MIAPQVDESLHDWSLKNGVQCQHCDNEEFTRCERCDEVYNVNELDGDFVCSECAHEIIADRCESYNDLD
jgi:uncharacterized C2H2 Zn-finger protein